jgi:hypothetical protein
MMQQNAVLTRLDGAPATMNEQVGTAHVRQSKPWNTCDGLLRSGCAQ